MQPILIRRILPLLAIVVPASAASRGQGATPSPLDSLPHGGNCAHLDTVAATVSGNHPVHLTQYRNDSAGRFIMIGSDEVTSATTMAATVGIRDSAGPRVVTVIIVFSATGKIELADWQGPRRPFLAHDSTLATMLFRETKARCRISG